MGVELGILRREEGPEKQKRRTGSGKGRLKMAALYLCWAEKRFDARALRRMLRNMTRNLLFLHCCSCCLVVGEFAADLPFVAGNARPKRHLHSSPSSIRSCWLSHVFSQCILTILTQTNSSPSSSLSYHLGLYV